MCAGTGGHAVCRRSKSRLTVSEKDLIERTQGHVLTKGLLSHTNVLNKITVDGRDLVLPADARKELQISKCVTVKSVY